MTLAKSLIASALLLHVCTSIAGERDGRWWARQDPSNKLSYLIGFLEGTGYTTAVLAETQYEAWFDPATKQPDKTRAAAARTVAELTTAKVSRNLSKITAGQLYDGLAKMYEDYRNQGIEVSDCIPVVVFAITGGSDEKVNQLLEAKRRSASR